MAPVTRSNSLKSQQTIDDEYAKKLKTVEDEKKKRMNKRKIELTCDFPAHPRQGCRSWFPDPASNDPFDKDAMEAMEKLRVYRAIVKQKMEAGEEEDSGSDSGSDSDSDSGDMDKYMEGVKKHAEVAKEYIRQVIESQGYDVNPEVVPKSFNYFRGVVPLSPEYIEDHNLLVIRLCKLAIEFYNGKKRNRTKYEFQKFAYANMQMAAGSIYLLTFHATPKQDDGGDKSSVVFEARVYNRTFGTPVVKVLLCRIKAPPSVKNVRVTGDVVEGNIIKGVGHYVGGREGPSKFEWFRLNSDTRERVLLLTGSTNYALTREDVGHRLVFKYIPLNSVGQEGKPRSKWSQIVKRAPPSVNNVPIVEDDAEPGRSIYC